MTQIQFDPTLLGMEVPQDEADVSHSRKTLAEQALEDRLRQLREAGTGTDVASPFFALFEDLRPMFLKWQTAYLIAWEGTPTNIREPKTYKQLAQTLGVSQKTLQKWRAQNASMIDSAAQALATHIPASDIAAVLRQSLHVATTEGAKGQRDRAMLLRIAGVGGAEEVQHHHHHGDGEGETESSKRTRLAEIKRKKEALASQKGNLDADERG